MAKTVPAPTPETTDRYLVHGYYTDEPQVVVDVVDANSDEDAIAKVEHARGGESSEYTSDGASLLSAEIAGLLKLQKQSRKKTAAALAEIAAQYAHYHDEDE